MKKRPILFVIAGFALTVPAVVALPRVAESRQEKHIPSQPELNDQALAEWQKADKELNAVYKKLLAQLDATGVAKLKRSQRAWVAYRDAEAEYAADAMRGGQAEPMLRYGTLSSLTTQRTALLKKDLEREAKFPSK